MNLHAFSRLARYGATASVLALSMGGNAFAQDAAPQAEVEEAPGDVIIVTAQRQAQSLQEVPIAVSAFSAEALDKQQIKNASDLQLSLPNVTFSKGNFTGSSFTIRGIGDLCVGVSCDSATAIHLDGTPLLGTRLFETEYFDLERIEVLRGPQGTLFGRNATSGVVNFIPQRPNLNGIHASAEAEYGNFNSIKGKAMINLPIGEKIGVRVAGFYLNRDGYTKNLFTGKSVDGRDMYSVRGSLRLQPTDTTTIDFLASYFHEKDDRLRIQKQLCQRDPTGVLGCLPAKRAYQATNGNSSFYGVLSSQQFFATQGAPASLALGNIYGADVNANAVIPADPRVINSDLNPFYKTTEQQYQARLEQELGAFKLQLTGFYHKATVDSQADYNLGVTDRSTYAVGLNTLAALAAGAVPPAALGGLPGSVQRAYFAPVAAALIPNGPNGPLCTSLPEETGTGAYGGFKRCAATPLEQDRSNQSSYDWSAEGILTSDLDGPFNFLLGGIYVDATLTENSYYVNSFGIDYLSGVLGALNTLPSAANPAGLPPSYLTTPFFRNTTDLLKVKSYGIFGEAYYDFSDRLKLTLGLRYNNDKKSVRARSTLLLDSNGVGVLLPHGSTDITQALNYATADYDPGTVGRQEFAVRKSADSKLTGRAVLDFKITPDSLLYASYSRGYKSGGINPPLQLGLVAETFGPEQVDAFEIGSKNVFDNGKFVFNLTGFYYKYKSLQLSRIVARTSVNDNVDADIYGLEAEAVIRPIRAFQVNLGASYLHTKVSSDKFLSNPRDPSGGRADAVIVKDITNGSNCAVTSNTGSIAGVNGYVGTVNTLINTVGSPGNPLNAPVTPLKPGAGLRAPAPFPADSGLTANGAFSICGVLSALASGLGPSFGGVTVQGGGVAVNLKGNKLPQAPNYKFSAGAQYTIEMHNDWSLTPRLDLTYTGESFGNIFNGNVNRIQGYTQANAQIQLDGPQDKWFVRAFIQNIFDSNATTGLYVGDQSQGLITNIFTLEPRRYGIAAGVKF